MFKGFEPSRLVVLIGFSGSGKSFLAKKLAEKLGYQILRSDVIRKKLAGLNPLQPARSDYGRGLYSPEMTKRVYQTLVDEAKRLINGGERVILDATFLKRWQRELVLRHFPTALFVWVYADDDTVRERLAQRKNDPSDADYSVYLKQKEGFEPPTELLTTFVVRSEEWEKLLKFLK
jgi:gluconokinase